MNDKERILMTIISKLCDTQIMCQNQRMGKAQFVDSTGREYAHFGTWGDDKPQVGDLVLCRTTEVNDFKVGFVEATFSNSWFLIREIGTSRVCEVPHETFKKIVGISKEDLLEGEEYIFQQKVIKAFRKEREYSYRYGGIEFVNNEIARVWIREVWDGGDKPSQPFFVDIKWTNKMSVKKIIKALREGGYGSREFEALEAENA